MKPLPPAPLTDEDLNLLVGLTQRRALRFGMWINERSIASDRRDAALMSALMEFGPMSNGYAWAHRALRGAVDRGDSICIDGYWVALA
jgi:hypothetical protein